MLLPCAAALCLVLLPPLPCSVAAFALSLLLLAHVLLLPAVLLRLLLLGVLVPLPVHAVLLLPLLLAMLPPSLPVFTLPGSSKKAWIVGLTIHAFRDKGAADP